jgi:superfamily II DNA or RNA helicase
MNQPRTPRRNRRGRNRPAQRPPQEPIATNISGENAELRALTLEQRCVRQFPKTALSRGRQYFASGRVSDPVWVGRHCSLDVRGAGGDYKVTLDFSEVFDGVFPVNCDCPAFERGTICKHLWTGILQVEKVTPTEIPDSGILRLVRQKQDQRREAPQRHQARPASPSVIRSNSMTWVERLNLLQNTKGTGDSSAFFVASASETAAEGKLVLDLWIRKWTVARKLGPLLPSRLTPQGIVEFSDLKDQELLSALVKTSNPRSGNSVTRFTVDPILEEHLVPMLVNSGKLFISRSPNGKPDAAERPLRMDRGLPWDLELDLDLENSNTYRLDGSLTRANEQRPLSAPLAILRSGFLLFDDHVGRFNEPKHAIWALELRSSNKFNIPRDQGDQFLTRVLLDPASPQITWPTDMGWGTEAIDPKPSGVFRPLGGNIVNGRMTLNVSFDYGGHEVALSETDTSFVDVNKKKVIRRNQQFEEQTLLEALKIMRDTQGTGSVPVSDLHRAAEELVQAGWTIFIENKRLRVPQDFSMNVSSNSDWFDLRMDVDFGDVTVSKNDLLASLRTQNGFVRLSDGSLGTLPQDWSSQYDTLTQFGEETADGNIRFSKSQGLMLNSVLTDKDHIKADEDFQTFRDKISKFEGVKTAKAPAGFRGELRTYQKEGLTWLRFLEEFETGGILADDMGLGKTIQVLAFLLGRTKKKSKTKKPHIVVSPKSLAFNWFDEGQKFAPTLKIAHYAGPERGEILKNLEDIDVLITTYGILRTDIEELQKVDFDVAIIDEAQAIKNPKSQAATTCKLINAKLKIALTGTPIENSITDLLSILEFTNPGLIQTRDVKQDAQAMLAKLLKPFMLRRTKEKVLTELPDRSEQVLFCEMSSKERQFYAAIRERYRASIEKKIEEGGLGKSKLHVLEALLRLRQAACHPGLVDPNLLSEPSAKIQQLISHMKEVIHDGHKVLVFSQFTSLLAIVRTQLEEEKIDFEYLDGQTDDRKTPVERFQNDDKCSVFLISLKAGGTGLNLTAADYVFILDPWWNPAVEAQAISRAHRMGQTNKVIAYRMIARGTVEEKILSLQQTKKDLAESIVSEDKDFMKKLTKEDLQMLLE